jgi:hypothetical protein
MLLLTEYVVPSLTKEEVVSNLPQEEDEEDEEEDLIKLVVPLPQWVHPPARGDRDGGLGILLGPLASP